MTRTPSRPIRMGVALVGVAGALTLAGCGATDAVAEADASQPDAATTSDAATTDESSAATGGYADGTYTAEGSYATPESVETVVVTLTIADEVVTDVEVTGDPQARESEQYQSQFIGGISNEVVGKSLDEVSVTRVAGSSLTSGGFMQALELIKAEAAS
ncbi:FMN-binding protein [Microbacterium sp. bgisy207]|uniref:FMN-binding protein n=1 Tax=Microbacterium sp. bgisy207 TaxID=3413800 RepID=UPI003EBAD001